MFVGFLYFLCVGFYMGIGVLLFPHCCCGCFNGVTFHYFVGHCDIPLCLFVFFSSFVFVLLVRYMYVFVITVVMVLWWLGCTALVSSVFLLL